MERSRKEIVMNKAAHYVLLLIRFLQNGLVKTCVRMLAVILFSPLCIASAFKLCKMVQNAVSAYHPSTVYFKWYWQRQVENMKLFCENFSVIQFVLLTAVTIIGIVIVAKALWSELKASENYVEEEIEDEEDFE